MKNSADPDQLAPTDLDLHCLLRQGMSYSTREGLMSDFTAGISLKQYHVSIPWNVCFIYS